MFAQRAAAEIREKKKQEIMHALSNDPKDAKLLLELAKLFLVHPDAIKAHANEACDLIVRAHLAGCRDSDAWKLRGDCHMALWHSKLVNSKRHLLHALTCYKRAMKSKEYSTDVKFLFMIAKAYKDYGSHTGSLAILSQIISTFKKYKDIHLVIHQAATLLFQVGKYKDSLTYLKHVLQRAPEHYGKAYILLQTARVFVAEENPRAAREVLAKARVEFMKQKKRSSTNGNGSISRGDSSSSSSAYQQRNKNSKSVSSDEANEEEADEAVVSSWASRPSLWIEAGMLYTKHDDIIFAVDALSHALELNSSLDAASSDAYISDFPYFVLSVAYYRVGDESRAIQLAREWLKMHKTDQDAKDAIDLWTNSTHASSESTVTLRTGLVVNLPPENNERHLSSSTPKKGLAKKQSSGEEWRDKKKYNDPAAVVHPIDWLNGIYKPPPSAVEIARNRAMEIAKKKAERERKVTESLKKKKLVRRLRLDANAKAAMVIQCIARGRYHRRRYAHKIRRHRRKHAIVLQRYIRGHNDRVRVRRMREGLKAERETMERNAEREAIALVDGKTMEGVYKSANSSADAYNGMGSTSAYDEGAYGEGAYDGGGYATTVPSSYAYDAASSEYYQDTSQQQYWNVDTAVAGGEWVEGYDAQSGRSYMYNEGTGETRWL